MRLSRFPRSSWPKERQTAGLPKPFIASGSWQDGWANPSGKATKDDLIALIGDLEKKDYSEYTKYDFRVILKDVLQVAGGQGRVFPKENNMAQEKSMKNLEHKLPEYILITEDEVLKLADAAMNPRDKKR
ncbi:MAG: hypothetical protein U0R44_02580 [Candidatus Micrarchaeia archaeon]